jgi:hypothetical protein
VAQPRIGFLAVDFGALKQPVDLGAGGRALGGIAEQPPPASFDKRLDRSFEPYVVRA